MSSRTSVDSLVDSVRWILGADVPTTPRLRNRRTLSSDRAPRRVFCLPYVLLGASAVGAGERRHEPTVLVRHMGLLRW